MDIRERVNSFIQESSHKFSLENYDYVTKIHDNDMVKLIYKQLGPFDYFKEKGDEDVEEKSLIDKFDTRRSGNMFRGEIGSTTGKPDGKGMKIFPNGSIYEGFFSNGHTHGFGRGISSKGEVYQGNFNYDNMEGHGFF